MRYENKSQREREQCKYKADSAAPPERPYWFPDEQVLLFLVIKRGIYVASF